MEQPDEKIYELEINLCDDGDILIEQGRCWSCDENVHIRLHRSQIPLIAKLGDCVPAGDVALATERLQDRFSLLASLMRAHTKLDDPLRIVVDELMSDFPSKSFFSPFKAAGQSLEDTCLPNTAGRAGEHPEQVADVRNGELFSGA